MVERFFFIHSRQFHSHFFLRFLRLSFLVRFCISFNLRFTSVSHIFKNGEFLYDYYYLQLLKPRVCVRMFYFNDSNSWFYEVLFRVFHFVFGKHWGTTHFFDFFIVALFRLTENTSVEDLKHYFPVDGAIEAMMCDPLHIAIAIVAAYFFVHAVTTFRAHCMT